MSTLGQRPDAIVIGSGLNALGVIRSLGQGGLRVASISRSEHDPPQLSRFTSVRVQAPAAGTALLEAVRVLVAEAGPPVVVFLTEEETVQFLADTNQNLHSKAICRLPTPKVLRSLLDKSQFDAICHEHGFPVPRSFSCWPDRPLQLPHDVQFPLIVKPAVKSSDYGQHFKKAYIVETASEADDIACRISLAVGGAIVQEWIPGGDEQIMFCLQYVGADGPVASFVGRKLRSWPPMFGGTASCTVAPEEVRDRLSRMTSRFFAVTGFQGMGSMEFKIDPRDDTPYLIEPTVGRTDFQEEVATVNGVNIPLAAFCHEASRPAPRCAYLPKAIVWIDNSGDTTVSRSRRLRDALTCTSALWRWTDPGPSLQGIQHRLQGFVRRRLTRHGT